MDFRRLQYFVRAVELGSLRQAAEELDVSQPALTRQIQLLEREFGTPLLTRERKRIKTTAAGEIVAERGGVLAVEMKRLMDDVRTLQEGPRTGIAVGILQTFLDDLLPRALAIWREQVPGFSVNINGTNTRDIAQLVSDGRIDIGVVALPVAEAGIERRTIGVERFVGVVSPYDDIAMESVRFEDFIANPLVVMHRGLPIRDNLDEAARALGKSLKVSVETDSLEAIKALVRGGAGRTILPMSAVARDVRQGNVSIVGITGTTVPQRTIVAIYRTSFPPKRRVWKFIEAIADVGKSAGVFLPHRQKTAG